MDWDYVVVGSGFGGSVCALRLVEKGYRVLVLEKGRRFAPADFPRTNWDVKRWLWLPRLGMRGLFQMSFFRHMTVLSGVGVGGGSLVYGNTLPIPKDDFFEAPSWARLAPWKDELAPHYSTARRMLGAVPNPMLGLPDHVIGEIAKDLGRPEEHHPTTVAVYFGESGKTVPDPYFGGEGPERTGCIGCGGCMLGCRHGAKNTLDHNYLWLAERRGLTLSADTEVTWIRAIPGGGYEVRARVGPEFLASRRRPVRHTARNVVLAGGVLGTLALLFRLKASRHGLPNLSDRLGWSVRTNSESLIGVTSRRRSADFSKGIAISSILHTDRHSHLEPVRYPEGSNFFRLLTAPHVAGRTGAQRLARLAGIVLGHPLDYLRLLSVPDWAKHSIILLYMRTLEGCLRLRPSRGHLGALATALDEGPAPTASIPEATDLACRVAAKIDGLPSALITETLFGVPSTAHILGGCCMGDSSATGVIDHRHRVFGYDGLYVVDGSAISANPGVNPSLTIAALGERAMGFVPENSR
ncbi:MAG: GMC family oxidoreductase [Planctomycetes bacterium]|nr:GMC family oxidoreductase [Planctomycetota bacterium]